VRGNTPAIRTPPLLASAAWRLALVFALYAYQGIVAGFALTALPNRAAELGASAAELGAYAALIGLPWILQPFWGPVVDRFGGSRMGRRRFWVLAALGGSLAAQSCLIWAGDSVGDGSVGNLPVIAAIFTLHSLCAVLMDTATDAMIIDHTPPHQLGRATACTRAGFVTGGAVGAMAFAWLLAHLTIGEAGLLLLGLGLLTAIMPLLVREAPGDAWISLRHHPQSAQLCMVAVLWELRAQMLRPAHGVLLLFCIAQDFCGALLRLPLGVHLVQQADWTAESLSTAQGAIGLAAGTLGAWMVGRWTDQVGPARALGRLLAASAVAHLVAGAVLAMGGGWAGPVALSLSGITSALCFVALAPAVMQASAGATAASRFALYMAALNLGDVLGSAAAGAVAGLGIAPLAVLVAAGYALLARVSDTMVRRFRA